MGSLPLPHATSLDYSRSLADPLNIPILAYDIEIFQPGLSSSSKHNATLPHWPRILRTMHNSHALGSC